MPDDLAPALSEIELVADIWAADAREARYVAERAVSVARLRAAAPAPPDRRIRSPRWYRPRQPAPPAGRPGGLLGNARHRAGVDPQLFRDRGRGGARRVPGPHPQAARHLERALRGPDRRAQDARPRRPARARHGRRRSPRSRPRFSLLPGTLTVAQLRVRVRRALAKLDSGGTGSAPRRSSQAGRRLPPADRRRHEPTDHRPAALEGRRLRRRGPAVRRHGARRRRQTPDRCHPRRDRRRPDAAPVGPLPSARHRPTRHPRTARVPPACRARHTSAPCRGGGPDRHRCRVPRAPRRARHARCPLGARRGAACRW